MIIPFCSKALLNDGEIFLEDKKKILTLNSFFIVGPFFDVEGSTRNSMDGIARSLGKEGADYFCTFKVDTLPYSEGLGKVK